MKKKKVIVKKEHKLRNRSQLELLTMALSQLYPADFLSPGLVLAWLPVEGLFYGSLVRYDKTAEKTGHKQVLYSTKDTSLTRVVQDLAMQLLETGDVVAQLQLKTRRKKK